MPAIDAEDPMLEAMRLEALDLGGWTGATGRKGKSAPEPVVISPPEPPAEPTILIPIHKGGFTAWCDGYRTTGVGHGDLVFLSIFGVQTSVRALWASLVGKKRSSIDIGGDYLSLDEIKYHSMRSLLSPQVLHLVIVHPSATSLVSAFDRWFYMLGDRCEEQYWARFNRMCQVPMRQSWRAKVWEIGLEKGLIEALPGIGLSGYLVRTTADEWTAAVCEAVQAGVLT